MIRLHFINVANGDSILVQYTKNGATKNFLIDTGLAEIPPVEDSMRIKAFDYLKSIGVDGFEQVIITHLHPDHVGGLSEIAEFFPIKQLISSYLPKNKRGKAKRKSESSRLVSENIATLNGFVDVLNFLDDAKTCLLEIVDDSTVYDDGELRIGIVCANKESVLRQNEIYDAILSNVAVPQSMKLWAASARNDNSMRVIIEYANRRIELDGDYYSPDWETQSIERCDILKVSHHGDCKGMSRNLAHRLKPSYSVISCQKDYIEKNDRPSQKTIGFLRESGSKVFYTDSYREDGHEPKYWKAVLFTIEDDGLIVSPEEDWNERKF